MKKKAIFYLTMTLCVGMAGCGPKEKLKALNVIMRHQTGKSFDEFQKNPKLEKAVAIIRVELNEYSCKRHG